MAMRLNLIRNLLSRCKESRFFLGGGAGVYSTLNQEFLIYGARALLKFYLQNKENALSLVFNESGCKQSKSLAESKGVRNRVGKKPA